MKVELSNKQQLLLDTAERLFSQKGYDGTSVRDIAAEAGINTAMISYYFGSKEKLMESIFERKALNVKEKVDELIKDESIDAFEKMFILLDDYVEKIMDRQKFHRIMLCEQIVNQNPVIKTMLHKLKTRNGSGMQDLVKYGQKKGVFKKTIDVPLMHNTIFGTITYVLINLDYYKSYHNLESLPDADFETLLKKRLSAHLKTTVKAIISHEA